MNSQNYDRFQTINRSKKERKEKRMDRRDRDRSRSRSRDRGDRRPSSFISEDPEELKKKLFIGNLFYEVNYCV